MFIGRDEILLEFYFPFILPLFMNTVPVHVKTISCILAVAFVGGGVIAVAPSVCGDTRESAVVTPSSNEAERLVQQARSFVKTNEWGRTEYTAKSFPLFLRAAELGNAEAQYAVAECYFEGLEEAGVKENASLAAEWYAKAAAQGHAKAIEGLANCYEHGRGVEEDQPKAFELHKQALAAGNDDALGSLAYCYFYGWGVKPDGEKAIEYCLKACEHGGGNLEFFWVDREEAVFRMEASTPNVRGWAEKAARDVCRQLRAYLASCLPGEELSEQPQALLACGIELARQGDGEAAYRVARCLEEGYYMEDGEVVGMDGERALIYHGMAVEAGFNGSLFALGQMYEYNHGIDRNSDTADFWYELAAERGSSEAAQRLAFKMTCEKIDDDAAYAGCRASALNPDSWSVRREAEEVIRSGKVSIEMLRYLAGQGNREVMAYLGECYEQGLQGVAKDAARAVLCFRRAAEQGSPLAQYRLGCCYAEGRGVEKDEQKAAALFEQATKAELASYLSDTGRFLNDFGDSLDAPYYGALRELANCYAQGLGVEKSIVRALELYLQAGREDANGQIVDNTIPAILAEMAAKGLIPENLANPAQRLVCGKALLYAYENCKLAEAESVALLQRAATQGDPRACFLLCQRFDAGSGVPQDTVKAFDWMHRSAASGGSEAAFQLALHYESGEGLEKDLTRAAAYYKQAAEAGYEEAWLRWGNCLVEGKGTAKNAAEGVKWYKKAFYKRNPESALLLADCYEKGVGVPQNAELAAELRKLLEPEQE